LSPRDGSLSQCFRRDRQAFLKIPALKDLAPTQTEPPFKLTQLVVLSLFVVLGIVAANQVPQRAG